MRPRSALDGRSTPVPLNLFFSISCQGGVAPKGAADAVDGAISALWPERVT